MKVHVNLEVETGDKPTHGAIEVACDALRLAGYQVASGHWHDVEGEHADH
jgi:hypothetical protein